MYKAFEDFYKQADIKHLLLDVYNNKLVSPPFATEKCTDYSNLWIDGKTINLELPEVTSKTNATAVVDNSMWFVPYGIYDKFNTVVQLCGDDVIHHTLPFTGKGQYYSVATNYEWNSAFSFPLGYEGTNHAMYINNNKVSVHKLPTEGKKLHMGTVYCNGRYWSMPRGDEPGYNTLLSFDGTDFQSYELEVDASITRKYSDIIVKDNTLYSLPFGETKGLNTIVEFDTVTNKATYYTIDGVDFAKKYNCGVLVGDKIIALPYGDEHADDSNWGLVFDTVTKQSHQFDMGISFGGKYRFRSGINYKNHAYFFPSGTPSCPILKINQAGEIVNGLYVNNMMLGRPIIYNDKIHVIGHNTKTNEEAIYIIRENLDYEMLRTVARP